MDNQINVLLKQAINCFEKHDLPQTQSILNNILKIEPKNFLALNIMGVTLKVENKNNEALLYFDRVIKLNPNFADAWSNKGLTLIDLKRYDEALQHYDRAIQLKPDFVEALSNKGNILKDLRRYDEALQHYDRVIELKPNAADGWYNKGNILKDLKRYDEALQHYDRAIKLKPDFVNALLNKGNVLNELECYNEALQSYDQVIQFKPNLSYAWYNKGNILKDLKRYNEALQHYDRAIQLNPDFNNAWNNKGLIFIDLKRYDEALQHFDRAIQYKLDFPEVWANKGFTLRNLKRYDESLQHYDRAIQLKPDFVNAWHNKGNILDELKLYDKALACYEQCINLNPDAYIILGDLVHAQMNTCKWDNFEQICGVIEEKLLAGNKVSAPFPILGLFDSPELEKRCAEIFTNEILKGTGQLKAIVPRSKHEKIRVGYFSMDFHKHPVSYHIAELIESHDRNKFEVYAYSLRLNKKDEMNKRLKKAFDKFFDVTYLNDLDVTKLSRQHKIDIAIDLGGHTQGSRPHIFAERAAPIQISYIGYPGTWGNKVIDYIILDKNILNENNRHFFHESLITIAHSYACRNEYKKSHQSHAARASYGIPSDVFVFCSFNNNNKITPFMFDTWIRILKQVPNSIIWIYVSNWTAEQNLRSWAKLYGLEDRRLLFSNKRGQQYIDQYLSADLFLDTFPYNAGSTFTDAILCGCPIITLAGNSFVSRMCAAQLMSCGLNELITENHDQYEKLAIKLALNPEKYNNLKKKIQNLKDNVPFFDLKLYVNQIETAYNAVYDRYHAGLPPDHIDINP